MKHPRTATCILIATWLMFCWLAMQLLHELGHLVAAWWLGIEVVRFHFGLLTISHTMLNDSGQTQATLLAVTWAGPLAGMLLPLAIWGIISMCQFQEAFLARFLAGFCLVANGCYLLCGPADGYADTGVLLANGAMRWQLITVGIIGVIPGFLLWNRQGSNFGIGQTPRPIRWKSVVVSAICLVVIVLFALFLT
jgi:hypothetical protein